MRLTNQEIENCFLALSNWQIPPMLPYKARMRLIRNHRKLTAAFKEKEELRIKLAHTHVKDGSKIPSGPNNTVVLTPDEFLKFQPEYHKLMAESQDVDIHPLEIYSATAGHAPLDAEHAINLDLLEEEQRNIPTSVQSAMLDVVLFEPGHEMIKQALAEAGKNGKNH